MENSRVSKKVKALRKRKNLTQEDLAEISGLSLRTIQRIENGKVIPRGDSLSKIINALQVTPDEIIGSQLYEDKNVLTLLNISQLGLLVFPLIGIIIPLVIWIQKKDKIKGVQNLGKSILNFQITWTLILFLFLFLFSFNMFFQWVNSTSVQLAYVVIAVLYIYNLSLIILNSIRCGRNRKVFYKPALGILH